MAKKSTTPIKTFKTATEANAFAKQKTAELKQVATQSQPSLNTAKVTPAVNTGSTVLNQEIKTSGTAKGTGSSILDQALQQKSNSQLDPLRGTPTATSAISGFPITPTGNTPGNEIGKAAPITADDLATANPFQLGAGAIIKKGVLTVAEKEAADLIAKETAQKTAQTLGKIYEKVGEKSINKIASLTGKDASVITEKIASKMGYKELNNVVSKMTASKWAQIAKIGKWAGAGVATTSVIATWYAADNVIGGTKILSNQLVEDVYWGNTEADKAIEQLEDAARTRDIALSTLKAATAINPLLWPFRNMYLNGAETDSAIIDANLNKLRQMAQQSNQEPTQQTSPTETSQPTSTTNTNPNDRIQQNEESQMRIIEEWQKAKDENRQADAAYWESVFAQQKAQQDAENAYWDEVRKKAENVPSKLNFGIL